MNSFIYDFFAGIYKRSKNTFENSFLNVLRIKFNKLASYLGERSFAVGFFSSAPKLSEKVENSVIVRFVVFVCEKILSFFKNIFLTVQKSTIIDSARLLCKNILYISLRCFGLIGISFAFSALVSSFIAGNINVIKLIIFNLIFILSFVLMFINTSLYNVLTNSIVLRKCLLYFDIDNFEEKDLIYISKSKHVILCVLSGIVIGICTGILNPIIVGLFICGIIGASAVLYNYKLGIYICAFAFPFLPTMALVGLVLYSFMSMVINLICDENAKFVRTPLDLPIILFAIVLVISAFTSFAVANSIMVVLVYLAFMTSYFLLTNTVKTKKQLYALVSSLMIAALFVALYGIYQYVFGFPEGATWIDSDMFSDIETRVVSTFENPNVLGEYLLLMIPIGMALVWSRAKWYNKGINLCITGVLGLCMIYTFSRGNWLGLMFAAFVFLVFYDRRFIWLGAILLLFSPMFLPESILNRFLSIGDTTDTSTSYRVYIWFGTFALLKHYWFCGIGPGPEAFSLIYPHYSYAGIVAPHAHNLYLHIMVEDGILGVGAFAFMIIVYFKDAISTYLNTNDRTLKAIIIGLVSGMFGFLIQGLFDNVWYNYRIVLMFFIIVGITAAATNISKHGGVDN